MAKETTGFRVDLRLLLELGERLISRDEVAIVELVKNAYDADADEVNISIDSSKIEIEDDGYGMAYNELVEGWLTIGSSIKTQNKKTPKNREVLGEKGLGRLAILRLGKKVTLLTQKKGEKCYKLSLDWGEVKNRVDFSKKYSPIETLKIDIEEIQGSIIFQKGQGTRVIIENLNSEWTELKIDKLKTFLSKLIDPRIEEIKPSENEKDTSYNIVRKKQEQIGFLINFIVSGEKTTLEPPEITKKPHYKFIANIDSKGNYTISISWNLDKGMGNSEIKGTLTQWKLRNEKIIRWEKDPEYGCGPFSFNINVWDLDAEELKGSKGDLRKWSGLSLVRNNFRVVQPDIDWLGLNLRRVQNPTMRLSSNQIIGGVYITAENSQLIDKTDREGLIENEAFSILRESFFFLLSQCEKKRFNLRREKTLKKGTILQYIDTSALKTISEKLPEDSKKEIDYFIDEMDEYKVFIEQWALGRDRMATMGLLGARLIHEGKGALALINDTYPIIRNSLNEVPPGIQDQIKRMVEGGELLKKLFNELNPFLRFRQKQIQEIKLMRIVDSIEFLFGPEFRRNRIDFRKLFSEKIFIRANTTDIYVLLSNIIDNAIYWLNDSKTVNKIIEIRVFEDNEKINICIADSGPGIDNEDIDTVFLTGYSTKPDGFGLGLSIVKDIVESYQGSITVEKDEKLGGAAFKLTIPYKS